MAERLQKILAQAGIASRRSAEAMILADRVSVNGRIVNVLGTKVLPEDDIQVDGKPIRVQTGRRYVMVHKPVGYVTTLHDPEGRPTVKDLVSALPERVYPVGRLDCDSEGLLLMTSDGDFAYRLQHPRFGVPKTYHVKVAGTFTPSDLKTLVSGIMLHDGLFKPLNAGIEKLNRQSTWLSLTITEGRNRIIRRALGRMGYPVRRLIRVAMGKVQLGTLKKGGFRDLTDEEMGTLAIFLKKFS